MSRRFLCVLVFAIACGDDGGDTGTSVGTSATAGVSTGEDGSSTSSGGSSDASSSSEAGSGSGSSDAGSSGGGSSSSGGPGGDPLYPPLQDGMCPGGEVPTMLPGGSVCAPFCDGEGAQCPAAATGDAVGTCTPFERDGGGSGDPCETHDMCPREEACGIEGTCIAVAFWACRLLCDGGQTCPDAMQCTSIGTCGYP
jgi:hypothetical protein